VKHRGVQLVILCEDDAHRQFAYHVLQRMGFHKRKLRFEVSAKGTGAADRFVVAEYPRQMAGYRRRSSFQRVGLLVCLDCDTNTTSQRTAQLERSLDATGAPPKRDQERVAVWLPRRNIETWFAILTGEPNVDEITDYKASVKNVDIRKCATSWFSQYRAASAESAETLPSLADSYRETRKIEQSDHRG